MDIITICIVIGIIFLIIHHIKTLNTLIVDSRGYERDGYGTLIHRKVAYKYLYNYPNLHHLRFGEYDIHHIDRNKRNNSPENLKILTREEHKEEHGIY